MTDREALKAVVKHLEAAGASTERTQAAWRVAKATLATEPVPAVSMARLEDFIGGWRAAAAVSRQTKRKRATELAEQIDYVLQHLERIMREG